MTSGSPPAKRAPEPLQVVQEFVNSADLETGEDELASPGKLRDWFAAHGLASPARVIAADVRRAQEVREGLRSVLATHNGVTPDREALARLERATASLVLRATFPADGRPGLVPARDGAGAGLATLLAAVAAAANDGSWERLKACADESCRWAFYDHSKNRSGRWCSMAVCGNQEKARAYRERHR